MVPQEGSDSLIVNLRLVELLHQVAVAGLQELAVQPGLEVKDRLGVVAGAVGFKPAFLLEPVVKLGLWQGAKQTHHRGHHPRALDEVELLLEDIRSVAVEADDEAAHHFQARALEGLDGLDKVAALVLHLVTFLEAFGGGRFDAHKDLLESGLDHQLTKLRVVREVD